MWLFTGRYAHLGGAICLIALVVASVGIVFLATAFRVIQKRDLNFPNIVNALLVAIPASLLGYAVGTGEQVFVSAAQFRHGAVYRPRWHRTWLGWCDPVEQ